MAIRANALAVMAKAPVAGQVKTRLVPVLTEEEAAELCRALLLDQLNHLGKLETSDLYLAFAPEPYRRLMQQLAPPCFRLFPQEGEDLGARMQAVFATLFAAGHKHIVLVGGDLAPVPPRFIEEAYDFLAAAEHRVVLGPSRDGGYYLVGCNRPTPQMFHGMTWSHGQVLTQTRAKLASLKIDSHLLPTWFDIDTPDELDYLQARLGGAGADAAPNTFQWLRGLGRRNPAWRVD
jgi:rSAM/selenodomain-associated transferase 1